MEVRDTTGSMALTTEAFRTGIALIVRVIGTVDGETAPEFRRVCHQSIAPGDHHLILDMTEMEYISSAGLSSLLSAGKEIDRQGGRLLVCGLASRVKQIFNLSGFDVLYPVFETREAALADCVQKSRS